MKTNLSQPDRKTHETGIAACKLLILFVVITSSIAASEDRPDLSIMYNKASGRPVALINNTARPRSRFAEATTLVSQAKSRTTSKMTSHADNQKALRAADIFLSDKLDLLGLRSLNELRVEVVDQDRLGLRVIRLSQSHNGVPVYGAGLVVTTNQADEVLTASGAILPSPSIETKPVISSRRAIRIARKDMERRYGWSNSVKFERKGFKRACRKKASDADQKKCVNRSLRRFKKAEGFYSGVEPKPYVYNESFIRGAKAGDSHLAWNVIITNSRGDSEHFMVNAADGSILMLAETKHRDTFRTIYDCTHGFGGDSCWASRYSEEYQYRFGRTEGEAESGPNPVPGDAFGSTDVDTLYDMIPLIHGYYIDKFTRDGANNLGGLGRCEGTPEQGCFYPYTESRFAVNYDGLQPFFCYGRDTYFDGFNPLFYFCSGKIVHDVVGHEYAHAVAFLSSNNGEGIFYPVLTGPGQSGALNESNADLMGEAFEKLMTGETNWIHGSFDTAEKRGLRSPQIASWYNANDGKFYDYPDRFNSPDYACSAGYEEIYINSGVPSKAAYLAAEGTINESGYQFNGCQIQGIGLNKVEQIWYRALTTYYTATTSFNQAYFALNQACQDLIGFELPLDDEFDTITEENCQEVRKALQAVEMDQAGFCSGVPGTVPACAMSQDSADFDSSGNVDLNDYQILRANWNLSNPSQGDANSDGVVNLQDYNIWLPQFQSDNPGVNPPSAPTIPGDLNLDGVIDPDDFVEWTQSAGQTGPGLPADTDVNGVVDNADLQIWAAASPSGNPADVNDSGTVDLWDYNLIRAQWNQTGEALGADINSDGLVGVFDYQVWLYLHNQPEAPPAPTISGDYDFDGDVDAQDYTDWKAAYGDSGPGLPADGNADGVINAADYTVWRNNLGATVEPPALVFYPGDCDLDGDVDGTDFLQWQRSFGADSPSALACDFNGDLIVDGADLDLWRANFGNGAN